MGEPSNVTMRGLEGMETRMERVCSNGRAEIARDRHTFSASETLESRPSIFDFVKKA